MPQTKEDRAAAETPLAQGMDHLYGRPGFLLRRCHQASVSIFLECCEESDLTPGQYGILYAIRENPGVDMIRIARAIGLDRSTVSNVVDRLAANKCISIAVNSNDKRRRSLSITREGLNRLLRAQGPAARAHEEFLAPLTSEERKLFTMLLRKLTMAHGERSRVPFDPKAARHHPRDETDRNVGQG